MKTPVEVTLDVGEFVFSATDIAEASKRFANALARMDATWEPHDWSEFS